MLSSYVYLSHPRMVPWPDMIRAIDEAVLRNNRAYGLTGVILFRAAWIVQYLEGETAALEERMAVITDDVRHRMVWKDRQPAPQRMLPGVDMGYIDVDRDLGLPAALTADVLGGWTRTDAPALRQAVLEAAQQKYLCEAKIIPLR